MKGQVEVKSSFRRLNRQDQQENSPTMDQSGIFERAKERRLIQILLEPSTECRQNFTLKPEIAQLCTTTCFLLGYSSTAHSLEFVLTKGDFADSRGSWEPKPANSARPLESHARLSNE